uniref:DUF668 family protein n=1 Tax=Musa acuminata subsp. malaccensis TaxID=214687 RepID=A0A804IFB4_MUSAM|nr:PREDICTED: uncharacterized protein LOC103979120 [Musa acuminata subsp. malaccensis]XP_018679097.1 PREDICTED: uncharacterized protein LOC103979120 [Musa acuminata subsp. malaccensis]XP_018679098.1 PREDICTED: uncharacterized protein LOC103979120 [Musa acuminata subsp. malaccensis]
MGGLCSKRSAVDKSPSDTLDPSGFRGQPIPSQFHSKRQEDLANSLAEEAMEKRLQEQSFSFRDCTITHTGNFSDAADATELQFFRDISQNSSSTKSKPSSGKSGTTKVSEVGLVLSKAGSVGLGKAVEVLDTLGSSMTNLHLSSSFVSGVATKGNQISILSFEVANTIVKGSNLMQSLSMENIKHLKEVVLPSEGVQYLISKDMDELLKISAADKREELKVFSKEVIRFGNRCKDPQWHNLERYFDKLASELTPQSQLKEVAKTAMEQLMTLAQYTAELYHELHALDRFDQDYRRKNQEEGSTGGVQRGDTLQMLRQELKSQRKHVKSLKKRSLWSKNLEEVLEKLVDIVHFLHFMIHDSFGSADTDKPTEETMKNQERLGPAGLALHYANIITQIDTLVSRSSCVPTNTRESLYQGLPPTIKHAFRSRLQSFQIKEELTIPQIRAEMEISLRWLVPIANNTTKAHHGFGWVGEWANTGSEVNRKPSGQIELMRMETFHHADKDKTEAYILDLLMWLHHLVRRSKPGSGGIRSPIKSPVCSPAQLLTTTSPATKPSVPSSMLTQEDQEMLQCVNFRKLTPGISRSQEFDTAKTKSGKHSRLSKSNSHSPTSCSKKDFFVPWLLPVIDFDIDKMKALDMIDRLDDIRKP